MLRISISDNPAGLTFRLEGRLTGPWVDELEKCWRESLPRLQGRPVHVDLTGLTYLCPTGKSCLAALHQQGATFIAADCLTRAVVAEITEGSSHCGKHTKGTKDIEVHHD